MAQGIETTILFIQLYSMNRLEDSIRDYLAGHLDLLEPRLALIQTEFRIPNPDGAGGRIDIVAKDQFGHFVVIEIKRSNQAARQALNEIHKYTALFRIRQGLDEKSLRVMVVSTEWHELLLPLSEYAASTPYSVEGIKIVADSVGVVTGATRVDLTAARGSLGALEISRCQGVYLFESSARRNGFAEVFVAEVQKVGIQDFMFLHCDYTGTNPVVIYPHALYLCFSSPLATTDAQGVERLKEQIDWEDDLDEPDENFAAAIRQPPDHHSDTFEAGYPEKLTSISKEWSISVAARHGRLSGDKSLLSDSELLHLAQATSGGSQIYYGKVTSPRFQAPWADFRENIVSVVDGYPKWQEFLPHLLDEIEASTPKAAVSASVYAPANLLVSLYSILVIGEYSRFPRFEAFVEDAESATARSLLGFLVWNGKRIERTASEVIQGIYGDPFSWLMATSLGGTFEYEAELIKAHNLEVVVVEWEFHVDQEDGPREIAMTKNKLKRKPPDQWAHKSLKEFAHEHQEYLAQLQQVVDKNATGLRESILSTSGEDPNHDI